MSIPTGSGVFTRRRLIGIRWRFWHARRLRGAGIWIGGIMTGTVRVTRRRFWRITHASIIRCCSRLVTYLTHNTTTITRHNLRSFKFLTSQSTRYRSLKAHILQRWVFLGSWLHWYLQWTQNKRKDVPKQKQLYSWEKPQKENQNQHALVCS